MATRWPLLLVGAVGTATVAVLLMRDAVSSSEVMLVAGQGAALGLVVSLVVTAPVTPRPVGRVELGLRVAVATVATVAWLAVEWGFLASRQSSLHPSRLGVAFVSVGTLLLLVAHQSWKNGARWRPGTDGQLRGARYGGSIPPPEATGGPSPGGTETEWALAAVGAFGADGRLEPVLPRFCAAFKRLSDVVVASVALLLSVPVLALAAVSVARQSNGGWLFSQIRLGATGRPFKMLKLRTMQPGNDDREHRVCMAMLIRGEPVPAALYGKVMGDARCTPVGRFLRRYSIDELPQLWNVLRGQMSMVGPRPPLPWEAELYEPWMWGRLAGKPGLTGLWQVNGRGRLPFSEMVQFDLRYWQNWTPWLDIKILLRTPKAVLWSRHTA